ncbi:enoyl-CoA hydratase/isomerase family protein [Peribacillus sp. NPDC096540]|uniref:enoyl-CoA hydratase/isomerase family protein n=1 Tax=Peribacillus sp. NPDC096540 TaxID=3390612 RepID=UPI003CFCB2E8
MTTTKNEGVIKVELEVLKYEIAQGVATVYLNRPPHNPLNWQSFKELSMLMDQLDRDSRVRAVIITGSGDRSFAAGADIKEMMDLTELEILQNNEISRGAFEKMERLSKPIIAAVNGLALGGGAELALACDLIICSERTKFGFPEINLGIIPGGGGTQRFQRLVGQKAAKEILYFGEMFSGERAYELGFVNKVVPADQLLTEAKEWAVKLAGKSSMAIKMMKKAVNAGANADLDTALDIELACFGNSFASPDRKEGMQAFVEKRKANFK